MKELISADQYPLASFTNMTQKLSYLFSKRCGLTVAVSCMKQGE